MNLNKFDLTANPGATLELRDPAGAPIMKSDEKTPVTITLLAADSAPMLAARNASLNTAAKRGGKLTAEAVMADSIRLLAKATTGWDGIGIDEDETPFSYENAVLLYTRFPFIREQVDTFVTERVNFLTASA